MPLPRSKRQAPSPDSSPSSRAQRPRQNPADAQAPPLSSSTPPSTSSASRPPSLVPSPNASPPSSSSAQGSCPVPPGLAKFGDSFFIDENEPEYWNKPIRLPDIFPRDDWTSATWSPPDMSSNTRYVSGGLFQWAGKFASVAVTEALEGSVSWDEVGDHGVYLALVDLMLQCRDYLRIVKGAEYIRTMDPSTFYISHQEWLVRCTTHANRIFDLAMSTLPPAVGARLQRAEAVRLCLAAVVRDFMPSTDAATQPRIRADEYLVPVGYLQQYDTTSDQLEKYGVCVIQGSVSFDTSEESLLKAAEQWEKENGPTIYRGNPLLGRPLEHEKRVPLPVGKVPGSCDAYYKHIPRRRGDN